jgi:DNA-binding NtrC family response regulator
MSSILIIDKDQAHSIKVADRLRGRQLIPTTHRELKDALQALYREASAWDIVLVDVSDLSLPWLAILRQLLEACSSHSSPHMPLFLCTSRTKRDPQFQLALERLGVRFVYER